MERTTELVLFDQADAGCDLIGSSAKTSQGPARVKDDILQSRGAGGGLGQAKDTFLEMELSAWSRATMDTNSPGTSGFVEHPQED